MKLQFDANQQYQLDATTAVTDLFDGQPQGAPEVSVILVGKWGGLFAGRDRTELGVGNHLLLATEKLLANTRAVQARNDSEIAVAEPRITRIGTNEDDWPAAFSFSFVLIRAIRGQRFRSLGI